MSKKIIWTAALDDALETLLGREEKMTFKQICQLMTEQFGLPFTANGCIGRAHRLRMPPRPPRIRTEKRARPYRKVITMPIRIDAPILPKEAQRALNGRDLTLIQLREGDCRWPSAGDKPPYTYCGRPTQGRRVVLPRPSPRRPPTVARGQMHHDRRGP